MTFGTKFKMLSDEIGKSPASILISLGLHSNACLLWDEGAMPGPYILCQIAEYFDITVKELTDGVDGINSKQDNSNDCSKPDIDISKFISSFNDCLRDSWNNLTPKTQCELISNFIKSITNAK